MRSSSTMLKLLSRPAPIIVALLLAGCSSRTGDAPALTNATDPGAGSPGTTDVDAGTGDQASLASNGCGPDTVDDPPLCGDGLEYICDSDSCGCKTPPDPPACPLTDGCAADGDCGDGSCCFEGLCLPKTSQCACGYSLYTFSRTAALGCPDSSDAINTAEQIATQYCASSAPMFGDFCHELGRCDSSLDVGSATTQCYEPPEGQYIGGVVANVCARCDYEFPAGAPPPPPTDACAQLQVDIDNKKTDINVKQDQINDLADGISKFAAAAAHEDDIIASLQGAEDQLINGTFGTNIVATTTAQSTLFVVDVVSSAKNVTKIGKGLCEAGSALKGTNCPLVGNAPQMSWKNVAYAKKYWNNVTEPTIMLGISKGSTGVAGACMPGAQEYTWWSLWPGYNQAKWGLNCVMAGYFGCDLTSQAVDNIGTARTAAQSAKAYFLGKKKALEAERDQALQDLGVLKSQLAALLQKYKEQCTCNMGP